MVSGSIDGFFPARPTLTPVFVCALSFWALCALGYLLGKDQPIHDCFVQSSIAGVSCLALVVAAASKKGRVALLVLASACLGFSLGAAHAVAVHQEGDYLEGFSGDMVIELAEDSTNSGFGESAIVHANVNDRESVTLNARFSDCGPLLVGQRFACKGSVSPVDYERNRTAWSKGSSGMVRVNALEPLDNTTIFASLVRLRATAIQAIGNSDDGHRLLQALVCGYRREIRETEAYANFQACGLAHLVAVSGAHLVIVTGLFAALLRSARSPKWLTVGVLLAIMVSYLVLAGMPVSALRATVMAALGLVAFFGKRRASSLNAIGVGVFGILLMSPSTCLSASFALSGLSTAGIVLFAPFFQAWFERVSQGRARFVTDALSLTLSAGLLSQLFACSLFSQLPLISPLANMVTAPLFPLVCTVGLVSVFVSMLVPPLAGLSAAIASLLASFMSETVSLLALIPYASIPYSIETPTALAVSFVIAFTLWACWPRRLRHIISIACACGAAGILAFMLVPPFTGDRIVMLDVGQGDAFLVQSRGESMLVDTGNQDTALLDQLARCGIARIGTVLITHADDDHCGSLDALRKAAEVERVVVAHEMLTCDDVSARSLMAESARTARNVIGVQKGDSFTVGAFCVRVVWPAMFTEGGGNADSLCVALEYDGNADGTTDWTALMTGDAEKDQLRAMIDDGSIGDIDLLKVGHHGSRNGSTIEEIQALDPEIALISCGAHNRYGHPAQDILDMLSNAGAAIYRTDENGQVRCLLTDESIEVECEKDAAS